MIIVTSKRNLVDRRGRSVPVASCYVSRMTVPRGGWSASFIVKKLKTTVSGVTPNEVFNKSKKLLTDNDTDISDNDLWFSLNYQWISRVADSDLIVPREIIEAAASNGVQPETPREFHHPSEWGSIEWNSMAHYLNVDDTSYTFNEFLTRVEITLKLLNPVYSSRVGCVDCFREFSKFVGELRTNPIHNLKDAKMWLFNTHNTVNKRIGKPELTYTEAKKINRWS